MWGAPEILAQPAWLESKTNRPQIGPQLAG